MKKLLGVLLLLAFCFSACSKKQEARLEIKSPEAFAYSMPEGWELNASAIVKGFEQKEEKGTFLCKLSYTVDLITPDGRKEPIISDSLEEEKTEEFTDLQINCQKQLSREYKPGKYKIRFVVKDGYSGKSVSLDKEIEVTNE